MRRLKLPVFFLVFGAALAVAWPYLPQVSLLRPNGGPAPFSIGMALKQKADDVVTDFEIRVSQLSPAGRMVTAAVHENLSIRKGDPSWVWGDLDLRVDVPVRVLYAIDLAAVKPGDITWDAERRVMTVFVPDIGVESIEFDLTDARTTYEEVGWWRSESGEGRDLARTAENQILSAARELARQPALFEKARLVSLPALKAQLQKVLRAVAGPDALCEVYVKQNP